MKRRSGKAARPARGRPLQQRSRETQERILQATERLMSRLGSAEFSLADVSRESGVSVGGFYRRFPGREALVEAVQLRVYGELSREYAQVEADAERHEDTLEARVYVLVAGIANMLRRHAPTIKAIVEASWSNTTVARAGVEVFHGHARKFRAHLLRYRQSIRHEHPEHAVDFCFSCVYELVASHFGFGRRVATDESRWSSLVSDLQRLCLAFLTSTAPPRGRGRAAQRAAR